MFSVFGEVKRHIPTSGRSKPGVSSALLHTLKLSMLVTIMACVLVTAKQYIGQNINCISDVRGQEHKAVENYCFISGTFTVADLSDSESVHPGVGPYRNTGSLAVRRPGGGGDGSEDEVQVHSYYQWVPIVLALQAGIYFLPAMIWKQIDKGFFETTLCNLNVVYMDEADEKKHIRASAQYLAKTMNQHTRYAITFLMVEILGFAIAVGNLFLTNAFLGGEFFKFGPAAVKYLNSPAYDPNNPLNQVFPKVAKCTWYKYGPSGGIQELDALCVLPLNIVNEKTYIFLWVCYITAAVVTGIVLLQHFLLFSLRGLRNKYLLRLPMKRETREKVERLLRKGNLGDWFLIWNFKHHMVYFGEWVNTMDELITV